MTAETPHEFPVLFENYIATGEEPPKIAALYSRFTDGEDLDAFSPAEIKLIFHLLPPQITEGLDPIIKKKEAEFWNKHMDFRRVGYEAVVGKATTFREDVANFASLLPGDQVIDLGGGFAVMAPYFASTANGLEYYDVENAPPTKTPATELIERLIKEGRLVKGGYIDHSLMNGFPDNLPGPENGRRIAISVASASYLPADKLQELVKSSFKNGCEAFYLIALRADFNGEVVIQEIEARAPLLEKTPEGGEILKNARAGYEGTRAFGKEITIGLSVRSPQETAEYLARVGKVVRAVDLGTQTFGILVKPS